MGLDPLAKQADRDWRAGTVWTVRGDRAGEWIRWQSKRTGIGGWHGVDGEGDRADERVGIGRAGS